MTATCSWDEELRDAFARSGLTAYALSRRSGVSQMTISRWLARTHSINVRLADKLAGVFGLPAVSGQFSSLLDKWPLTAYQLALETGVTDNTCSALMAGKQSPKLATADAIRAFLEPWLASRQPAG